MSMLTTELLTALKSYTANMKNTVSLVLQTTGANEVEHRSRKELVEFLTDFSSASDKIALVERDTGGELMSPISFSLEVEGKPSGIQFSGIPGGHEFNSLVLAVLRAAGTPIKLDESIANMISAVNKPLQFEVFVSLSCHNCPDVVQALNEFAQLNPMISCNMIDGGLFPEIIEKRNIQGVPSVYLNGEPFANGKIDTAQLLDKLVERHPEIKQSSQQKSLPLQDVTVIGGGPAGVSAAIYSARKGLKVTLIADRMGGQVKDTVGIENLISVSKTTGSELTAALQTHMRDYDITLREHLRVEEVVADNIKTLKLSSGELVNTKSLIVASGARWRELNVPGEKENVGKGVAYCPHCDGPFFKGKDVAVVGGGNSGIEAALDLAGIVKSVTVFEFMPELKADQVLVSKAEARDNITILRNVAVKEVLASGAKVSAIAYQDRTTGEVKELALSGIFVQIGLVPNSQFVKGVVDQTAHGEIKIDERGRTSQPGIFACGDVTTVPYKQIVIAMGEGAKASLAAFDYLLKDYTETLAEASTENKADKVTA